MFSKSVYAAAVFALLAGCAQLNPHTMVPVTERVKQYTGQTLLWPETDAQRHDIQGRIHTLLSKPLSVDAAVELTLLNNPGLQATLYELWIADAERVQASGIPNPRISLLRARHGDDFKIEQSLVLNVLAIFTWPQRQALEQKRFEQTQQAITQAVLSTVNETKKAYFNAVAAQERLQYAQKIRSAAQAGATLAERLRAAGNWTALQAAREQAFSAQAEMDGLRAEQAVYESREQLLRLLGLEHGQALLLPERLPDLPAEFVPQTDFENIALKQRIDVLMAKQALENTAEFLGLTRATRWVNALDVGPARVLEGTRDQPYKKGYVLSLEVPLFDWGDAKVARAEATYMQALQWLTETAVQARSEVRQAHESARVAYAMARQQRDTVLPMQRRVLEETLLHYNGMLLGVFDLLLQSRNQSTSVMNAIDTQRDYWLADTDLQLSLIAKPTLNVTRLPSVLPVTASGNAH